MLFKKKILLTKLAEGLSNEIAVGTMRSIQERLQTEKEEDADEAFYTHFFAQLMTWSITSISISDDASKQVAFAITDQLPYRYAEMNLIEGFNEEYIRSQAEVCMNQVVERSKSKKSDLGTALGFWAASRLKGDPMNAMMLPLEFIQNITANANLINSMKKKCKINYNIKY